MSKRPVTYVTSNDNKRAEFEILLAKGVLADGTRIIDAFDFRLAPNTIQETLEVDLDALVRAEAVSAYKELKRPCIVEHAGLIFSEYLAAGYPGGLTKPMWKTLKDRFIEETNSSGRLVTARAAIGYCDGQEVHVFRGETEGRLAPSPQGPGGFYWDTVFIPDGAGNPDGLTYAEISEGHGLEVKVMDFSQSRKAMLAFLEWRLANDPVLWKVAF